jgi:hypothetical protein
VIDRIGRELRRHQLAVRMISHRARRRTICNFTGLTRQKIKTLRHEWNVRSKGRRRGPSPTSVSAFFANAQMRTEASVIALFCKLHELIPATKIPEAARLYPNLERGERLCEVFEAYGTYLPESTVSFELITLLAIGLAAPAGLELVGCATCQGVIVVDALSIRRRVCSHCAHIEEQSAKEAKRAPKGTSSRKKANQSMIPDQQEHAARRKDQHAQEGKVRGAQGPKEERGQHPEERDRRQDELNDRQEGDEKSKDG